jgi:hypothetical protein
MPGHSLPNRSPILTGGALAVLVLLFVCAGRIEAACGDYVVVLHNANVADHHPVAAPPQPMPTPAPVCPGPGCSAVPPTATPISPPPAPDRPGLDLATNSDPTTSPRDTWPVGPVGSTDPPSRQPSGIFHPPRVG